MVVTICPKTTIFDKTASGFFGKFTFSKGKTYIGARNSIFGRKKRSCEERPSGNRSLGAKKTLGCPLDLQNPRKNTKISDFGV